VHEVAPAVLYDKTPAQFLTLRLVHEIELPAVVELPDQSLLRKDAFVGNRASGLSLLMPVAFTINEPWGTLSSRRSFSSGSELWMYSTLAPERNWLWTAHRDSSRAGLRLTTTMRRGRSSRGRPVIRCKLMARLEPPAPNRITSAPLAAQ